MQNPQRDPMQMNNDNYNRQGLLSRCATISLLIKANNMEEETKLLLFWL